MGMSLIEQLQNQSSWHIALIATGLLLQGAVIAVFPEEVIICALGVLWGSGKIGFFEAFVAVECGLLPANLALVLLGRHFGRRILTVAPFRWFMKEHTLEKVDRFRAKYGKR